MSQMAGKSRSQLIGSSFPDYFAERERAVEGVRLTFKEGSVTNYVLTLHAGSDRQIPVSFNAAVFRDPLGNIRGIFASARDITAQRGKVTNYELTARSKTGREMVVSYNATTFNDQA